MHIILKKSSNLQSFGRGNSWEVRPDLAPVGYIDKRLKLSTLWHCNLKVVSSNLSTVGLLLTSLDRGPFLKIIHTDMLPAKEIKMVK